MAASLFLNLVLLGTKLRMAWLAATAGLAVATRRVRGSGVDLPERGRVEVPLRIRVCDSGVVAPTTTTPTPTPTPTLALGWTAPPTPPPPAVTRPGKIF